MRGYFGLVVAWNYWCNGGFLCSCVQHPAILEMTERGLLTRLLWDSKLAEEGRLLNPHSK